MPLPKLRYSRAGATLASEVGTERIVDLLHRAEVAHSLEEAVALERERQMMTQQDKADARVEGIMKGLGNFVLAPGAASAGGLSALFDLIPGAFYPDILDANAEEAGRTLQRVVTGLTLQPSNPEEARGMGWVNTVPEQVFGAYDEWVASPMGEYISQEFGVPEWMSTSAMQALPIFIGPIKKGVVGSKILRSEAGQVISPVRHGVASELVVSPTIGRGLGSQPKVASTGREYGAPPQVAAGKETTADVRRMITDSARRGLEAGGKEFWERSGQGLIKITGGNVADADKLAGLWSIYNAHDSPERAMIRALTAFWEWKNEKPITPGTRYQRADAAAWLHEGKEWGIRGDDAAARKTRTMYRDLRTGMGLKSQEGIPADTYMYNIAGFPRGSGTNAQYDWVERAYGDVARDLGLPPHQVQAASWVDWASAVRATDNMTRRWGIERGILVRGKKMGQDGKLHDSWIPNPKIEDSFEQYQLMHRKFAAEHGISGPAYERGLKAFNRDAGILGDWQTGEIAGDYTWGKESGIMPELLDAPYDTKLSHAEQMVQTALDENGSNMIVRGMGLTPTMEMTGPGYWEGVVPGHQTGVLMPTTRPGAMDPRIMAQVRATASLQALLYGQDWAAYNKPLAVNSIGKGTLIDVRVRGYGEMTPAQVKALYNGVADILGPEWGFPAPIENGTRWIFTGDKKSVPKFQQAFDRVMHTHPELKGIDVDLGYGNHISDYWYNKVKGGTTFGENYVKEIADAGATGRARKVADLVDPRIRSGATDWAKRRGAIGERYTIDWGPREQGLRLLKGEGGPEIVVWGDRSMPGAIPKKK